MGKIHYKWPFSIAMLVHQRVRVMDTSIQTWHFHGYKWCSQLGCCQCCEKMMNQAIWGISIGSCAGNEVQNLNINFPCLRWLGCASQVQTSLAEVKNYGKYNRMGPPVELACNRYSTRKRRSFKWQTGPSDWASSLFFRTLLRDWGWVHQKGM